MTLDPKALLKRVGGNAIFFLGVISLMVWGVGVCVPMRQSELAFDHAHMLEAER